MDIKALRMTKGWSQEQLSEFSGLNVRTIQRIEKGQKASDESLKALAAVFELDFQAWSRQEKAHQHSAQQEDIEHARQQVARLRDFYTHIGIYVIANVFLFTLNLFLTPQAWWFHYPLFCWIVGLAIHGFTVFHGFDRQWERKQIDILLKRDK